MYIIRGAARAKRGHTGDVIRILKENVKSLDSDLNIRILINVFGDSDLVVGELAFETMQEATASMEKGFDDTWETVITEGGWFDVTTGNVIEMWKVVS